MPNKFVGLQILLYLCTAKVYFPVAYFLPIHPKYQHQTHFWNMKRKILTRINLILGTISLALAGCHTQKNATNADNGVVALYGITVEDYQPVVVDSPEQNAPADSILPLPTDSAEQTINDMPRRDPQIMVKYGVMRPRK